jgi:hypothetical protein
MVAGQPGDTDRRSWRSSTGWLSERSNCSTGLDVYGCDAYEAVWGVWLVTERVREATNLPGNALTAQ